MVLLKENPAEILDTYPFLEIQKKPLKAGYIVINYTMFKDMLL